MNDLKNDYEVRGDVTAIFLRRKDGTRLETIIDTNDFDIVNSFPRTWTASKGCTTDGFYVYGRVTVSNKKRRLYTLHRLITNCPDGMQVDHINHNTLDNRRSNLEVVTRQQNTQNFKVQARRGSTSGIRGVSRHFDKWRAHITISGKQISLGVFASIDDAAKAVKKARGEMMSHSPEAHERRIKNAGLSMPM